MRHSIASCATSWTTPHPTQNSASCTASHSELSEIGHRRQPAVGLLCASATLSGNPPFTMVAVLTAHVAAAPPARAAYGTASVLSLGGVPTTCQTGTGPNGHDRASASGTWPGRKKPEA